MSNADPIRMNAQIYAFFGRPSPQELPPTDVEAARIGAGMEVLRAIARNTGHGFYGAISALVTVAHNAFLPAHDGEPGIPLIVPYAGADAREGLPATPNEIDSWRLNAASFAGTAGTPIILHDQSLNGRRSPLACRYSLVNKKLKYTGYSAQVPLVQLTRAMADAGVPDNYEPTIVRLACVTLIRASEVMFDRLKQELRLLVVMNRDDLLTIQEGKMTVKPLPGIALAQKQVI